jgi:hypothetical protein
MHQRVCLLLAGILVTLGVIAVPLVLQPSYPRANLEILTTQSVFNQNCTSISHPEINKVYVVECHATARLLWATPDSTIETYYSNSNQIIVRSNTPSSTFTLGETIVGFSVSESHEPELEHFQPLNIEPLKTDVPQLPGNAIRDASAPAPIDGAMTKAVYRFHHLLARRWLGLSEEHVADSRNASFSRLRTLHLPRPLHGPAVTAGLTTCGGCPGTGSETVKRSFAYVYSNSGKETAWASSGISERA